MTLLLQPELQIGIKLRLQHHCLTDNACEQATKAMHKQGYDPSREHTFSL